MVAEMDLLAIPLSLKGLQPHSTPVTWCFLSFALNLSVQLEKGLFVLVFQDLGKKTEFTLSELFLIFFIFR